MGKIGGQLMYYYGVISELIDELKMYLEQEEVNVESSLDGKINIYLKEELTIQASLEITEKEYYRDSIPFPFLGLYEVELQVLKGEKDIFDRVKSFFDSYSIREVNDVMKNFPLLNKFSVSSQIDFSEVAIIWRDHFLEDSLALLNTFLSVGLDPKSCMVFDKGDLTKNRGLIWNTFERLGFEVNLLDNASLTDPYEINNVKSKIDEFYERVVEREFKKLIVIDDGAFVTEILDLNEKEIFGVIELTEMGLRRINATKQDIHFPILNVAKTDVKRDITYPEIGNVSFQKVINLLSGQKLIGKTVIVIGYGDVGKNVCNKFQALGCKIVVVDNDYHKMIVASETGMRTYISLSEALKFEEPFLVIGASGEPSIYEEDVQNFPDDMFLTTLATADLTFLNTLRYESEIYVPKFGYQYSYQGKNFTVLGNGRSVNLFHNSSISNKGIDVFKASILLATILLVEERDTLPIGLTTSRLNSYLEEKGIYKAYYYEYLSEERIENTVKAQI